MKGANGKVHFSELRLGFLSSHRYSDGTSTLCGKTANRIKWTDHPNGTTCKLCIEKLKECLYFCDKHGFIDAEPCRLCEYEKGDKMPMTCTRCDGTGFLNLSQIDSIVYGEDVCDISDESAVLKWIETHSDHDVQVCDCCGDGEGGWYGTPGEHYNSEDPVGKNGPYASNGGLCRCH